MEIIHVVRQYRPSIGGLEDAVYNLCAQLARREGVSVRVVTLDRWFAKPDMALPREEVIDGIRVTRLPYFGSTRYPIALSILREIQSASIVHVHAIDFFFDFLAWTKIFHGKPLVASTHGGFFHTSFASRLKKIYFRTMTRVSAQAYRFLCASSENDAATFRQIAGDKVVTIENGVNVDKWRDCAHPTPQRSMIFIGRWARNKSLPVLIDLIAALRADGHSWRLVIAGLPGDESVQSLTEKAQAAGILAQVSLVPSPQEAEIATLIGGSSYIASASVYEGFGISLIEGLSAGLLPLTSPIPTFDKVRKALGFGVDIDAQDLQKTAQAIEKFHENVEKNGATLRAQAIAFSSAYDWKGVADRFMDVYAQTLGKDLASKT